VTFWDCAEMYPVNPVRKETAGRSEAILGSWLATRKGARGRLTLATKAAGLGKRAAGGLFAGRREGGLRGVAAAAGGGGHRPLPAPLARAGALRLAAQLGVPARRRPGGRAGGHGRGAGAAFGPRGRGQGPRGGAVQRDGLGDAALARPGGGHGGPAHGGGAERILAAPPPRRRGPGRGAGDGRGGDAGLLPARRGAAHGEVPGGRHAGGVAQGDQRGPGRAGDAAGRGGGGRAPPARRRGGDGPGAHGLGLAPDAARSLSIPIFGATTAEQLGRILGGLDAEVSPDLAKRIDEANRAHPLPF
jgi:hypothetical protein